MNRWRRRGRGLLPDGEGPIVLSLFALVAVVAALLAWVAPKLPTEPRGLYDKNSETPINEPDQYPASSCGVMPPTCAWWWWTERCAIAPAPRRAGVARSASLQRRQTECPHRSDAIPHADLREQGRPAARRVRQRQQHGSPRTKRRDSDRLCLPRLAAALGGNGAAISKGHGTKTNETSEAERAEAVAAALRRFGKRTPTASTAGAASFALRARAALQRRRGVDLRDGKMRTGAAVASTAPGSTLTAARSSGRTVMGDGARRDRTSGARAPRGHHREDIEARLHYRAALHV